MFELEYLMMHFIIRGVSCRECCSKLSRVYKFDMAAGEIDWGGV
jgi:hypothetical protein